MKVLIVEDNEANRKLLRMMLATSAHEVGEAKDGVEALETLRSQNHDAVIANVLMPRMDGYRFCYEVRSDEKLRDLAIVIYNSTLGSAADEKSALRFGADRYLDKPASPAVLLATLEQLAQDTRPRPRPVQTPSELEVLKRYSERLVQKLEEKKLELEDKNLELEDKEQQLEDKGLKLDDKSSELEDKSLELEAAKEHLAAAKDTIRSSEEQVRLLLDSTAEGIYGLGFDGKFTFCNASSVTLLGYTRPEEVLGKHAHTLIHHTLPDGRPYPEEECGIYRTLREDKGNHSDEDVFWRADGTSFPVEFWSYPVRRGGKLAGAVVTFHDITERKRSEIALRESEMRQRAVFEAAPDALITMDHEGNVIEFNPAAVRILGFSREEVLGKPLADLIVPPELRDRHRRGLARYLATGEGTILGRRLELPALRKDGEVISAELTITRGNVEGPPIFTGFLRDITELKRAEKEIRRSEERFRRLFDSNTIGIAIADISGGILETNDAYLDMLGYTREEHLAGKFRWDDLTPPEHRGRDQVAVEQLQLTGVARPWEKELIRKDGSRVPVLIGVAMLQASEGSCIAYIVDLSQQRQSSEALRRSEERYRLLFHINPQPMWVFDEKTFAFLAVNEAACRHYGYSEDEFLGMTIREIRPAEEVSALLGRLADDEKTNQDAGIRRHRTKEGNVIEVEITSHPLLFDGREAQLVLAADMTARRQLELQLRQSQKMEAVGQLAGGVAHDFNNLLTVILGYSDLLATEVGEKSPLMESIDEIRKSGERAASLTRQLLAFSRRQVLEPKVLEVNALVSNLEKMLHRLIGEDMNLVTLLDPAVGRVYADAGQIEQVILNLAVNSRDAMPKGGRLTIETSNVDLDDAYAREHVSVRPGRYVMLAVTDTGTGMSAETKSHMFEPFFTTKGQGKGTGLGLATVYGIVKQSGGYIWVYSELDRGTTFKVYLPRVDAKPEVRAATPVKSSIRGTETILLVEDDQAVRALTRRLLEEKGYKVLEASGSQAAIAIAESAEQPIDLLLTDVVMPEMGGSDLASRLVTLRPGIKVLYMSGYTDDAVVRHGLVAEGATFLQKPFTPERLAQKVSETLASERS
jgi:two-component system cell cycle sensor histidine kinase/response regulator CckA